jgi:putative Mn2+ efflux pump MntP
VETSVAAILALGFILGLKHATDADHVVAVTTFVSEEKSLLRSCWIGAFWGAGHTLSLAIAGLAVILLKINIPVWIEARLEFAVAVMLVFLGGRVLYRTWKQKVEVHRHPHWHAHLRGGLRPLLVGMVHGAAGSGALMLLVLSTIQSSLQAMLYVVVFGVGSIAGMLVTSMLLALPLQWLGRRAHVLAGVFSCLFGIYLGMEIWQTL